MKLELLALKWVVTEKFRSYLLGSKFTIITDNNHLCHLTTAKLGAIEQRWAAQLAVFVRMGTTLGPDLLAAGVEYSKVRQLQASLAVEDDVVVENTPTLPGYSKAELHQL